MGAARGGCEREGRRAVGVGVQEEPNVVLACSLFLKVNEL